MNEHARNLFPAIKPITYVPPDDRFIRDHLGDPAGEQVVAAHTRQQFRQSNPQAIGAETKLGVRQKEVERLERHRDRLCRTLDRTPLLKHPEFRDREHSLTRHEWLKYLLLQGASLAGIGLAAHVLATYMSNSNVIPDLSGNYFKALLFAATPFILGLGLKSIGLLPEFEEGRPRYLRWLRGAAIVSGLGFIVSAALAFAPHMLDVAALSDALASGSDPDGLAVKTLKSVSPYALTLTHLFAEVALAPILALGADAIHASGREVVEKFSERSTLLQDEIDRLNNRIVQLSDEAKMAAYEAELLADAEREAVRAAVNRRAELEVGLNQHLINAKSQFKSGLGSIA